MKFQLVSMAALALAMFLAAPVLAAKDAEESTHDGKVVSVSGDKLVMTNKDGKEHSHTLAADAKVTCDGKACKAEDLKAGMRIRVTTKKDDQTVATGIEAISKNETFANTHDGKVVSMTGNKLVMKGKDDQEHSHMVAADAKVTCDGKVCKVADLRAGMRIRVTTKKDDQNVATGIEALDKDAGFGHRI